MPDSVREIGEYAFKKCSSLAAVKIPNSVQKIERGVFRDCISLRTVTIPNSVREIAESALAGCTSLTTISIPDSVQLIADQAFLGCTSLRNVEIKGNPQCNRYAAFLNCSVQSSKQKSGCYIATAVYGSYDCPEVWTLRRFRDNTLDRTWYGRAFIRTYYAISPTLVRWFGRDSWFQALFRPMLDRLVARLRQSGVEDTAYQDKY